MRLASYLYTMYVPILELKPTSCSPGTWSTREPMTRHSSNWKTFFLLGEHSVPSFHFIQRSHRLENGRYDKHVIFPNTRDQLLIIHFYGTVFQLLTIRTEHSEKTIL